MTKIGEKEVGSEQISNLHICDVMNAGRCAIRWRDNVLCTSLHFVYAEYTWGHNWNVKRLLCNQNFQFGWATVLCDARCNAIYSIFTALAMNEKMWKKSSRNKMQIYFKVTFYSIYFIDILFILPIFVGFFICRLHWTNILRPKTNLRLSNTHDSD